MAAGKLSSSYIFPQDNIAVLYDGMRHYPSQLLFLSEVLEADGFQTNPQTAYNSSSRHNGMEQRFPSPSERLQSLYAHTCVRLSGQEAVLLWGHNHIPCIDSCLSQFRPHKRSFPAIHRRFWICMLLLCRNPAPCIALSFFSRDFQPLQCFLYG